jgi:hypothetical protein
MDYDALAKQLGGQSTAPSTSGGVDYNALASGFGGTPVTASVAAPEQKQKKENIFKRIGKGLIRSEIGFGQSIAGALPSFVPGSGAAIAKQSEQEAAQKNQIITNLIEAKRKLQAEGKDTSRIDAELARQGGGQLEADVAKIVPSTQKSAKQVLGEGLGVAADIASFGTYGTAAKGAKAGQILTRAQQATNIAALPKAASAGQAFLRGAKAGAKTSAAIGAGYGFTGALQEDEDLGGIIKDTLTGAATGAVIGGAIGGLSERAAFNRTGRAEELKRKAVEQYKRGLEVTKEKYKQKADQIIPDLLDQKVWGTRKKLLEKAQKGLKLTGEEYEKLGELKGMIGTEGLLGKIDDEIGKYTFTKPGLSATGEKLATLTGEGGRVSSVNTARVKALQSLRDDILAISVFDEAGKNPQAFQEQLRQLAQGYGEELYQGRKSLKTVFDNKTLSQVKKVDGAIRGLLNTKNPDYEKINKVYHLNSELFDILAETAQRKGGQKWWSLIRSVSSGTGATAGSVVGGAIGSAPGAIGGAVVGGAIGNTLTTILNSAWWNTLRAVQKNNLANKLLQMSPGERNQAILMIGRLGVKGVEDFLNSDK